MSVAAFVGAAAVVAALAASGRSSPWRARAGAAGHGARWAKRRDLAPLAVRGPVPGRLVLGSAGRRLVAAEKGHSVLVVGPTQSYKTSGFAVPAVLEWEGPVLAVSVKADLAGHTLGWRRRRGEVRVFDPTGATGLRASWWSPLCSATSWGGARRVAHSLVEAARPDVTTLSDADFWYASATKLLGPLLLAASVSGRTMADVVRWLDEQERDEVEQALLVAGLEGRAALQSARATWGRDERQRSAVYATAETVVDAFADLRPSRSTSAGGEIDPEHLLGGANTLYLCSPTHEQRRLRPLFSALSTEVLDAAYFRAARRGAPLDPPLLVVLDEAANVAPLGELDTVASTAAGHGVQLVTVWQDLAQLNARYGTRASSVVNNHRVKVFLSGVADPGTLEHASALIGETEIRLDSVSVDGTGRRSNSQANQLRRLAPPDALRRLRPGTGVMISGHLPPVRLTLRPWWRHREIRRRVEVADAERRLASSSVASIA